MIESEIDTEFIEKLKSHDNRWGEIDLAIKIEAEMRDSTLLKCVLEVIELEASIALKGLTEVDPTDVKKIIHLQAIVYRDRIAKNTIETIRRAASIAQDTLQQEGAVEIAGDD